MNFLIKTIKGKVLFCCVPIPNDASHERIYMEGTVFVDTPKKRAIICGNVHEFGSCKILCKLSEVTEELASLLVDCPWKANETAEYKTAKESLFSLLKANGLLAKCMGTATPIDVVSAYRKEQTDIFSIPDDYLLIIKQ